MAISVTVNFIAHLDPAWRTIITANKTLGMKLTHLKHFTHATACNTYRKDLSRLHFFRDPKVQERQKELA